MVVHGRGESISLNNVFGILRGGYLWAKSTASLLNVCSTAHEVISHPNALDPSLTPWHPMPCQWMTLRNSRARSLH